MSKQLYRLVTSIEPSILNAVLVRHFGNQFKLTNLGDDIRQEVREVLHSPCLRPDPTPEPLTLRDRAALTALPQTLKDSNNYQAVVEAWAVADEFLEHRS